MDLSSMNVVEHNGIPKDGAWIVFSKDAPQVPEHLKNELSYPCVLTGDVKLAKRVLMLLQAINTNQPVNKTKKDSFNIKRTKRIRHSAAAR